MGLSEVQSSLCVCLSARQSVCLSVCMSVCLPFCPSVHPSVDTSVRPSIRPFVYLPIYLLLQSWFLAIILVTCNCAQRMRPQATGSNPLIGSIICPFVHPSGCLQAFCNFFIRINFEWGVPESRCIYLQTNDLLWVAYHIQFLRNWIYCVGMYQVFYVKSTLGILTLPTHIKQRLKTIATKSLPIFLTGTENLTSITVKGTTIGIKK